MSLPRPEPEGIPLSVYVHIPYCLKKCPYCDFNSHARTGELPEAEYLAALRRELSQWAPRIQGRWAQSIFFGGGTPSLFSPAFYAAILEELTEQVGLTADCEISLEANPGAAEAGRFAGFRAAGINRVSLGVQSLSDARLADLGRIHSAREAREAAASARRAGFDSLNLDLMFGLPGQGPEEATSELDHLLALEPDHVALYQLTLEPGTPFAVRPPPLPDEDTRADTEEQLRQRLDRAGFQHYEVSNHARPGHQCRHNRNYWELGDYLGLGAGAHGKLTLNPGILRTRSYAGPEAYLRMARDGAATAEAAWQDDSDCVADFALNTLRLRDGVPVDLFPERTGLPSDRLDASRERGEAAGLLEPRGDALVPTQKGRAYLDDLVGLFLAE